MATLSATDRQRIATGIQKFWSKNFETVSGLTADDVLETVGDADDWTDAAQSSYNSALPTVAQNNLTAAQKAFILMVVIAMRVGLPFLKSLVGEVD